MDVSPIHREIARDVLAGRSDETTGQSGGDK